MAAATLLRKLGATVTVVERAVVGEAVNPARRGSVVIGREGWDVLRRVGGGELLDDARNVVSDTERMASLHMLDTTLGAHAKAQGATVITGHGIAGVEQLTGSTRGVSVAIEDAVSGARRVLDADWYIDATGGKSVVAQDPRFARQLTQGPLKLIPDERGLMAAQARAQIDRGVGWTGPNEAFAINDRAEGVVTAYAPYPTRGSATPVPSKAEGDALLRSLGIDPADSLEARWTFTARQLLAPQAAEGRILLLGDSVGAMHPSGQSGAVLALTDAERAVQTIAAAHRTADPAAADAIISRYSDATVAAHRLFIR